ncbi:MAG: succinate dehydrogenase, cytochrome b556 subunit [Anaerolineae bacterium]
MAKAIEAFYQGITYRGREGQWAWILHRVAGLGVLLFLSLHIVDIFLMGFGPGIFNELLFFYRAPLFRLMEVFLAFGLMYHALNGIRIIIIDFWPAAADYQRLMVRVELAVFTILFLPAAYFMLLPLFRGV